MSAPIFRLLMLWLASSLASAQSSPPSFCKEVLVLHHSHLDVGYTHPQAMLWELQKDYLNEGLDLIEATADWPASAQARWTCEVTAPVLRWLETADAPKLARFTKYLKQGRLGISAWQYNTTPLSTAEGLARQLYPARELEQRFGVRINTAHCHDVTGLPWTVVDLLLDSHIELLTMGINLHLGGAPSPRPGIYRWRGPSGRELLVMNGEHYSMFDQWCDTGKNSLEAIEAGLTKYLNHLAAMKYPYDFIYLTATCAPHAYDNSPPNAELPQLIRQWNDQGRQPRIRLVTPCELLERIRLVPRETLPVVAGDWTDYWNFGAASAAAETRLARQATADLAVIDLLHTLLPADARQAGVTRRAWEDVQLYNEHTWGAAGSLNPDDPRTVALWQMKAQPAYEAESLTEYLLVKELQQLAGNPASFRKIDSVLLVNPNDSPQRYFVPVPDLWHVEGKRIECNLMRGRDMSRQPAEAKPCGPVELPPFGWKIIPLSELKPVADSAMLRSGTNFVESPFHKLQFDPATGRITSLVDKQRHWEVLDTNSRWGFFQPLLEKPDPAVESSRQAFHVRNAVAERVGITGWKPDWKAIYGSYIGGVTCRVEKTSLSFSLILSGRVDGLHDLEQTITLRADSPLIGLAARFIKEDVRSPESLYFAFPLNLPEQWQSHFDTAGIPTELDAEQIAGTCRDWVTTDTFINVGQGERSVTLYCPEAPLVQVGGFNFGRKQKAIPRTANPLLLAWLLNNYWETNFRASQPGPISVRYAFATQGAYDAVRATSEGRIVANPPLVHPVALAGNCTQSLEGRLLEVAAVNTSVLYVKPAEDGLGAIMRLINLGNSPAQATISLPTRTIKSAWKCSTQEENQTRLPVKQAIVECSLPARQVVTIRVQW